MTTNISPDNWKDYWPTMQRSQFNALVNGIALAFEERDFHTNISFDDPHKTCEDLSVCRVEVRMNGKQPNKRNYAYISAFKFSYCWCVTWKPDYIDYIADEVVLAYKRFYAESRPMKNITEEIDPLS